MFYRINEENNADIFNDDGSVCTKIDATVYPIGSQLSARYEHPEGIVLTISDANRIGISKE